MSEKGGNAIVHIVDTKNHKEEERKRAKEGREKERERAPKHTHRVLRHICLRRERSSFVCQMSVLNFFIPFAP